MSAERVSLLRRLATEPPRKVPSLIMQLTNIVGGILLFIVLVIAIFLAIAAINILWSLQ